MYRGERYKARGYHPRCKSCTRLSSSPILEEGVYAERVTYHLKMPNEIYSGRPIYSGRSNDLHNTAI
ncbi:hypothetical protein BDV23DRAFT_55398 [Aspergillus alliaceus]|uniref:Uncharacterized protein n=1 Tax=Petromyces alliaceus TaxID=209559 RepID=A0A5N7CE50_PETAA|nr:hypothetical protein BDV23DRAFT_55398 [Aspergillus alliaceus]